MLRDFWFESIARRLPHGHALNMQKQNSMWVGASEIVSKPGMILGVGVGVGIGIGLYERHSKQELIFFDPDSDPDPDVYGASSAKHEFGWQIQVLGQPLQPRRFGDVKNGREVSGLKPRPTWCFEEMFTH